MEINFKPIKLNDKGHEVTRLHQSLAALALPASPSEVAQGKAGNDTLKQVRALQRKLGVRVANNSPLLDEKTINLMVKAMAAKDLFAAKKSFEVSGVVRLSNGTVKKAQPLMAFDLDLNGVASYRSLKTLRGVTKGFEYLGRTVSDNKGYYSIRFYDWQYQRAERKLADIVVFALGDKGVILGHSRIANTDDYSDKAFVRDFDLILTLQDDRSEYQALMEPLNSFLKDSNSSLLKIALSSEQLDFIANELDVNRTHLELAATAALVKKEAPRLSHELLYGIARQDINLSWSSLFKKQQQELLAAIASSVADGIIRIFKDNEITAFITAIQRSSSTHLLDDKDADGNNLLTQMLSNALPKKPQRMAFLKALGEFKGSDFSEFWQTHLPAQPVFKKDPKLIPAIQLTQQLTMLTGSHEALVKELQQKQGLKSVKELVDLNNDGWLELIKKTGVPKAVEGKDEDEKRQRYADSLQNQINGTFPTLRIAKMAKENQLAIDSSKVNASVGRVLSNEKFDIAKARIDEFQQEIDTAAEANDAKEVKAELYKLQRVFQVSTSPEVMTALLKHNLHSAHTIASFPRANFVKTYGKALGGEAAAIAAHQRAEFISTRVEGIATDVLQFSEDAATPAMARSSVAFAKADTLLKTKFPNYKNLFGSPDLCECQHCRSVLSPAAYFVDLLRFLGRSTSTPVTDGDAEENPSPYDYLVGNADIEVAIPGRRPDLAKLALSCENTNTLIPYIDLGNEVMESYVVEGSLQGYEGENTGDATVDELRANPQHTDIEAYRILSDNHAEKRAKYPFSLPYHQPLDVIRTYSDFLNVSRYKAMQAVNPNSLDTTSRAIAAEALGFSQQEYALLVGQRFDGTPDNTVPHEYFGYDNSDDLEELSPVQEFMERSGIAYTELVELVKTHFVNPHQVLLDYLESLFSGSLIKGETIYRWLEKAAVGPTTADDDLTIKDASVDLDQLKQWARGHFTEFQQIITLFEPSSKCSLDTTRLRVIQSIYDKPDTVEIVDNKEVIKLGASGITTDSWLKLHRFVRLWRKTGWRIHETDMMLKALGEASISPTTIAKLESVLLLKRKSKLPVNQLAVLWGDIDTYGKRSLYQRLFLNKAAQQLDPAFVADDQGRYLHDSNAKLADHQSTILAAFRMSEYALSRVVAMEKAKIAGEFDVLNIQNLSAIYRYVVLAKALKLRVTELCQLIDLFGISPFNPPNAPITPQTTYEFYQLAASTKAAKFKPDMLAYIFNGDLSVDSKLGLDTNKTLLVAKSIRDNLQVIEQAHQGGGEPAATLEELAELAASLALTAEILQAKLSLTFQPEIVDKLMAIINTAAVFDVISKANLNIATSLKNNDELGEKFSYIEASGRLSCIGVMSDGERTKLVGLTTDVEFKDAVDLLYAAPETFINANFDGILSHAAITQAVAEGGDIGAARATAQATTMDLLLHRNGPASEIRLEAKLAYVYKSYLPVLKRQLQRNLITTAVADLTGLNEEMTTLLLAEEIDNVLSQLAVKGFSATYYKDSEWGTPHLPIKTDETVQFSWGHGAPFDEIPADNFSVQWESYIAAPASGEYTLMAEVEEQSEAFSLYLDGELIFNKISNDPTSASTTLEGLVNLNGAQLHLLTLRYAENKVDNAGIRLRWKTAINAPEIIPAGVAYPAHILNAFVKQVSIFHRAAKFIQGFKISATELQHFITFNEDFAEIDFNKLAPAHWIRIRDYAALRNSVPQAEALLTDIFALARQSIPLPAEDPLIEQIRLNLIDKIHQATAWDKADISTLINHFVPQALPGDLSLVVDGFKNEILLNRLHRVMKMVAKTGLSAATISTWGAAETDFDQLNNTAQLLKNSVKAKYNDRQWLDLASGLSDQIRAHQQQALISYLLVQPSIRDAQVKDADGLFEHLLIDVQMGACMNTSRIVQANAAIQLFVNRILLNLETAIPPDTIDPNRWQWMKNYRVWEANRKVFLYPENWLAPEWRNDRSEFFKDLESHLLQNDITERSVEQGLRNYLMSLDEVANLDVCGMHQENYDDGKLKFLHVFGRTHNLPYKYFYRRWNEDKKWSAWEKVQVDIVGVEDGEDSGVHLVPVVWKGRLFLFWPEFMEKAKENIETKNKTYKERSDKAPGLYAPIKYWEIRLAWSEYVDGVWSSKQVSKEFVSSYKTESDSYNDKNLSNDIHLMRAMARAPDSGTVDTVSNNSCSELIPSEIRVIPSVIGNKLQMTIYADCFPVEPSSPISQSIYPGKAFNGYPNFIFSDIQSSIKTGVSNYSKITKPKAYKNAFCKQAAYGSNLKFSDYTYLYRGAKHQLLSVNGLGEVKLSIGNDKPFFYSDTDRTYFVQSAGHKFNWDIADLFRPADFVNALSMDSRPTDSTDSTPGLVAQPAAAAATAAAATATATGLAFGASDNIYIESRVEENTQTEILQFHTFYHPFSSKFVTRLNQGGIQALMGSDFEDSTTSDPIISDEGKTFDKYKPNFDDDLVRPHIDDLGVATSHRTYYQENICFDVLGANSLYNWELFFHAPLYIATQLSKNGKYEEAMKWFHYMFDPTTNEKPDPNDEDDTSRYWKVRPFKAESKTVESLETWFRTLEANNDPDNTGNVRVDEWRKNPFDPHLVASNRPIAYMKHVVIKYIENLIDWGDSLFRQFTRESVYEAIQLYVIASHVLGKRPEFVPRRGEIKTETYASLKHKLDDFGNALVELENIFPHTSTVNLAAPSPGSNLLGIGEALYFCIPANDKLLGYWDTVADRLFKIRHCQDLDGVERDLALFAPAIDPAALIQARSQGLSLGSILADLSSSAPIYRFAYLLQKANEFCGDVKALGSAMLSAVEKRDGEELGRLRSSQEANMLERVTAIRERQVLAAKASIENLHKSRETAELRLEHYNTQLLGNDSITVPDLPPLDATLTANSRLPADTSIPLVESEVDMSLVDSDESGVKLIPREDEQLSKNNDAKWINAGISATETLAGVFALIPGVDVYAAPLGVGVDVETPRVARTIHLTANAARGYSSFLSAAASQASIMSGYIRRTHDWTLQANLVIRELIQLDKQMTSANIQLQVAEKELQNHLQQIENSKQVALFLKDKFSNQELYQWMKEQLFTVYKQSYNLAIEMAKKAEKAYQYEIGDDSSRFIQYGYWDSSMDGLVAGEKLQLGLRQLENEYLNNNRRELELSKSISVALLNPLALVELREAGKCLLSLPEELFDLDFQGHYFRRIKAVSLSIPCVAGPYTTVNCSLRLLKNSMRKNTQMNADGDYTHNNDMGLPLDDDRFRSSHVPVTLIATSTGQNDAGLFEFNFRDERYLPFEGAGVISDWMIELTEDKDFRQLDYSTISDVILHLKYTARETSGSFKQKASDHLHEYLAPDTDDATPSLLMFNLKQDFPTQWHRFLNPTAPAAENVLELDMTPNLFPVLDQGKKLNVNKIWVLARCAEEGSEYAVVIDPPVGPEKITLRSDANNYGGLHYGESKDISVAINPEGEPITWQLKMTLQNGDNLPEAEVEDVFVVLGYQWDD